MYPEQYLIDLIKSKTVLTDVTLAEDASIDIIQEHLTSPRVFVGHLGIELEREEDSSVNSYAELENEERLLTSIQFICYRMDLPTVRKFIKDSYLGESPFPDDADYGTLAFHSAKVIAKTSNKIWWQEIVSFLMPRIS